MGEKRAQKWVGILALATIFGVGIFYGFLYPVYLKWAYPCKYENYSVLKDHPAKAIVAKFTGRAEGKVLVCVKPEFKPIAESYMHHEALVVGVSREFLTAAPPDVLEAALAHEAGHYLAGHFRIKTLQEYVLVMATGEFDADSEAVKLVGDCRMAKLFRFAKVMYDERGMDNNFSFRANYHEMLGNCSSPETVK